MRSFGLLIFTSILLTSCSNPEKELPKGTLTGTLGTVRFS